MSVEGFRIEPAGEADIPVVLALIRELAAYERAGRVEVDEALLRRFLFCERPAAEVFLGYYDGAPVSYAIVYPVFSSYRGCANLWLEDFYVQPQARGKGIGRLMMAHLARLAIERGCAFLAWGVLNWNEPAIEFYRRLGARRDQSHCQFYLEGEALRAAAGV